MKIAEEQYKYEVKLSAERGGIFDRKVRPLAMNIPKTTIVAYPNMIDDIPGTSKSLARLLNTSAFVVESKLRSADNFMYISRNESYRTGLAIAALGLKGIKCRTESARLYPKGQACCQVIGFNNSDGEGVSGIERRFNESLKGIPGKAILQRTAAVNEPAFERPDYPLVEPRNGNNIILTIDYAYQAIAQKELHRAVLQANADSGSVIIMDSQSGTILALACEPGFNPNDPGRFTPSAWRLRAITDQYEPGSTFKLVLMSAILNEKARTADDRVFCEDGVYRIMGETIRDDHPYGWLSLREVISKSSSIGMSKLSKSIDKNLFHSYVRNFGFGSETGIEMDGEIDGKLKPVSEWSGFTPLAMSYGYGVAVTALQVINMFNTIANGGLLMKPMLVREIRDENHRVVKRYNSQVIHRVISTATADTLTSMMTGVVEDGTGKKARIPGVTVAGKTGTARKNRPNGKGYYHNRHIASFGGFFPAEKPRLTIYIMIDNPRRNQMGGESAAPCFKRIGEQIMQYEGVEVKSSDDAALRTVIRQTDERAVPNVVGYEKDFAEKVIKEARLRLKTTGDDGVVVEQMPKAGTKVSTGTDVLVICRKEDKPRMTVPRVIGLSIRNAINVLAVDGIKAVVNGTGRVVYQQPGPGQRITGQEQVLLHCESSVDLRKLLIL